MASTMFEDYSSTPSLITEIDELEAYIQSLSDDDYVDFIADFLKPTPLEMGFVVIFFILMVVGIIGNSLVVYVVVSNRHMWSSMNLFLTNLAVSDLLVLIFCLPPTVINDITKSFWFSGTFCKAIVFCQNTSVYVSILTLICVSFERWRAVCSPLAIARWRTFHVILFVWTLAGFLSIPEPITLTIRPHDYARKNLTIIWGTSCKESWSDNFQQKYQLVQTLVLFIMPLILISGLCVHMTIILQRKALQIGERQLRNRKKAIKMLVMVVLIFAISYLPVHLHNIATSFNYSPPISENNLTLIAFRKFIPRFMSYSASSLNPILYNFMSEKFRKEFRRACCCGAVAAKRRRRHYWLEQQQTASMGSARGRCNAHSLRYNSISTAGIGPQQCF
uniref:G-protein coupled receptors family 1 profile domain-containing protein n=1 Tax=Panagrolaimus sp. JU765 TaxID=591449 RepID=A0AC34RAN5_9BILA